MSKSAPANPKGKRITIVEYFCPACSKLVTVSNKKPWEVNCCPLCKAWIIIPKNAMQVSIWQHATPKRVRFPF